MTTVPAPLMVNARSAHNRTAAPSSASGSRPASRSSAARSSSSPSPVTPLTATASTSPSEVAAISASPAAVAAAGSARSERVTTSSPCRTPSASSAARCSADCGFHPSSAATTIIAAGTGPTPASMFGTNRSCPGTSTNATVAPEPSVVQANPRSIVIPRRRSCAHRSGSIPVKARTRVDFPWSTCPAVAMTCTSEHRLGNHPDDQVVRGRRDAAQVEQQAPALDPAHDRRVGEAQCHGVRARN